MEPRLTRYSHGITAIDTEYVRPGLAAAHVIVQSGRAAFVDSGTNASRRSRTPVRCCIRAVRRT